MTFALANYEFESTFKRFEHLLKVFGNSPNTLTNIYLQVRNILGYLQDT